MRFRDLPIRSKLLLMTLTSSVVALVLACGGLLAWDVIQFRAEIVSDVAAQARIIAANAAPELTFDDPVATGETLSVLRLRPRVRIACVYTREARLFATYQRTLDEHCPAAPPERSRFGWDQYVVVEPIMADTDQLGTLFIDRELSDVEGRLRVGIGAVAALLLVAIAASFLIAARMQRGIAAPLLALAGIARRISGGRDYSLRAVPTSTDEVGVVVHAFNDMLDAIGERTTALSKANDELQHEIEERRKVEAERSAALERERDANRLKDEFLATLSHELRTPLNAVLGWTRVLRAAQVEGATRERALESIERNARAQTRLIEDLLEISRIVTGKLRLHVEEADLAAIVDAAVEVVQPAAVAKRIRIHADVTARPALTAGDPDRLQQVVWNLLSNAVKFTPENGEVWIRLERQAGYRLVVRDNGAGIDAKFLPFVFEPFRQADGTASREHGGLGLGLAIAKQLVELHGGTIVARSFGRGAGATFELRLPSVLDRGVAAGRPRANEPLAPAPVDPDLLRHLRVLVVDDEDDARALMETTLMTYGADVVSVPSVEEALAEIDRRRPDVVVSDIGMPQQDGHVLLRTLRARSADQGGSIPAIAVTAYASAVDRETSEAAGYQAHVAKPFEPAAVAALVARFGRAAQSGQLH